MADDRGSTRKLKRWDVPFDPEMTEANVDRLLAMPSFREMRLADNPAVRSYLLYDCRMVTFNPSEIIVRRGDYGSSAFFILKGTVEVVLERSDHSLPDEKLGRRPRAQKGFFGALSQLHGEQRRRPERDANHGKPSRPDGGTPAGTVCYSRW